jgi:hypothetical protein
MWKHTVPAEGCSPTLEQLRCLTAAQHVFEQAKGVLMDWFCIAPAEAEDVLLSWAYEADLPADRLAGVFVHDVCQGRSTGCDPSVVRLIEAKVRQLPIVDDRRA